jgi:hypothetical protein
MPRHPAEGHYDPASADYVVAPGDDLLQIGERAGVSVADRKALNELSSDEIKAGQTLRVATDSSAFPAAPKTQYKMTTAIAPGVAIADRLDTSIGTLHLRDGVSTAKNAPMTAVAEHPSPVTRVIKGCPL